MHAAVALDAWIERKPYPQLDVDILCAIACYEYAFRNDLPPQQIGTLRGLSRGSVGRSESRWDLYCTFCGELLQSAVTGKTETDAKFNGMRSNGRHGVECALKHLAFALEPAAPNVKRLPDSHTDASLFEGVPT